MRTARFVYAVAFVLGLAPASYALDPHRAPSQYVVTRWGVRDLSSNSVHALLQTRDGYLWLGTTTGLVRFDGARFVVYNSRNTASFSDGGASSLAEAPDGSLYIGTTAGAIMRHHQGAFTAMPMPMGSGFVSSILPAADGSVWAAVHGRVMYRWKDGQVDPRIRAADVKGTLALSEHSDGIWAGGSEGLLRFSNGTFVRQPGFEDTAQALHRDRAGALWIGTPHGLVRLHEGRLQRFTRRDGLSHDNVSAILEDRDGNLWVGTSGGGLNRYRDGRFTRFTLRDGLSNDHVQRLLEDHEGNLWVGTADGLNCLSDGRFVTYGRLEGIRDPSVTAVAPGRDGSVWIGMNSGGVARLRGGFLEHFDLPAGAGREAIIALYEARDGSLWTTVDDGRLFRLEDGKVTEHTPREGAGKKVRLILEDETDLLFFVSDVGLARLRGGRLVPLHPGARKLGYLYGSYRDAAGTLWLCSTWGLMRMRDGHYDLFTTQHGLPHDRVRSVTGEPDGGLWVATVGGLAYFKDGRAQSLTRAEGLPENLLRLVLDDGQGHLWVASMGSLFRIGKQEVFDLFAGRIKQVSPITFDVSDGLRATEAVLSNAPGFRHRDGRLWFATAQGASVVEPSRISVGEPAPKVRIEALTVDGKPGLGRGEFAPGRGEVTIDYTAVSFRSWSKMFFRYRLDGLDDDWVKPDVRRTAYYSNLPPGRYSFAVMASNRDGAWTGEPTVVTFTLRPPFHRTPVFYALCVGVLAALVAGVHRFRVNQMRARFAAIIHERTRIARELHDTLAQGLAGLGIQIDTALSILPDEPRLGRVRQQMEQGLAMVRTSLAEVRRSIWVLRAQTAKDAKDLASSLSENLSQLTAEAGITSSFAITGEPRSLSPDLERNLLRIAHEAVTNAVRHAGARRISVALHFDADDVRLTVRDDGRGFDPEVSRERPRGDHFGLAGISERTRSLGGELRLATRPGAGTEIDCRLPYDHAEAPSSESIEGVSL